MKKLQLAILILVVIAIFISADYFVNMPGGLPAPSPSLPKTETNETAPVAREVPNVIKQILNQGTFPSVYTLEKRIRTTELFEDFNMNEVANISIYKNILISSESEKGPIYIYEIHCPVGQGAVSYLNIKLTMIDQMGAEEGINETSEYGYNSLFYNDKKRSANAFLLSQVDDIIFGFQYSKDSSSAFDFIKTLVNNYMSSITK